MSAGALIAARQNRYIRRFREAEATEAERARRLEELGCRDSLVFRRLVARNVFVASPDGRRYHLDLAAAEDFRAQRRARVLAALVGSLLVLAVLWWLGGF